MNTRKAREKTRAHSGDAAPEKGFDWYAQAYRRFAISGRKRETVEEAAFLQRRLQESLITSFRRRS